MKRPAVVLFDLGGVLLPFDPWRRVRSVAEALGITTAAAQSALSAELFERMDLGDAVEGDFAAVFTRLAGRHVDDLEARALLLSVFEPPNAALWDLTEALRRRLPVGGFSDNPSFVAELFPAGARLDPMFWSAELGATKASEAAFATVEARLGIAGEAILFVDDTLANVERARRRGWDAAHFTHNAALRTELTERGLT